MRPSMSILSALFFCLATNMALALPDDRNQPIHVAADSARINEKTGITTYRGNVVITQGSILIEGDEVDLHRTDEGVDKVVAKGKPAHFRQKNTINDPYTDAWGLHMVYLVNKEQLTITDQAKVVQGQDTFTGQRIVYEIKRSIVNAFGGKGEEQDSGRVNMVIQPKKASESE